MAKEGEKKPTHERSLQYYKKTVQLLSVGLEVLFLFFVGAVIFLFVAGGDAQHLEQENTKLITQQQELTAELNRFRLQSAEISSTFPLTQISGDEMIITFSSVAGVPTQISVNSSQVIEEFQDGYANRELVDQVEIPLHTKYAQTCYDFALSCSSDQQQVDDIKKYFSDELDILKDSGVTYLSVPLGATTKYVMDFRDFVSPVGFEDELMGWFANRESDEAFIQEVWHVVSQVTTFSSEIKETPRYPLETLFLGSGDCEDSAILFASMIEAAQTGWKVSFLYMDSDHITQPFKFNHVIVSINTGTEVFFIETTSKDEMSPYETVEGFSVEIN
ncbi:MAG: hypothetical protein KC535_03820 [Nanoarchaeota archaeon]|nr:hypothetical protein [Nanoarchaeota archaeon]